MIKNLFFLAVFMVFSNGILFAQLPGFPGAEGAGKFTSGGRGTASAASTIIAVTNLSDDENGNIVGSLRWALTRTATYRTIIFRVSGTIRLVAPLRITRANTTIAGQTAPGGGICLADHPVSISANNVILRYLRFRMGDRYQNKGMVNGAGSDDALGASGRDNLIVDHCTMTWSTDEACSIYSGENITLQWNIMSEPLNYSYHFETGDTDFERHGYGGIWGGSYSSFHHNLFAHCQGRTPRFDGSRNLGDGKTAGLENCDFRNNVLYNWASYNVNGGEGGNYNIVNNYYKYGLNTSSNNSSGVPVRGMIINPGRNSDLPFGKYYVSGNYVNGYTNITNNNWLGAAMSGAALKDTGLSKVTVPFALPAMPTETALQAYESVLKYAGCVLPMRDTLDERIINNVKNGTGRIIDVQGNYPHGTAYNLTVNAWPTLAAGTPAATTNANNIPDEWLAQRGLTGAALSGTGGYSSNGYTHLENFLNGDSIVALGKNFNCVNARSISSTNSGKWIDVKDTTYTRLVSTDTNNVVISIFDDANLGNFDVKYYVTNFVRLDGNDNPYLGRNVSITPTTAISTPVKVRMYFSKAEYDALKAADLTIQSLSDLVILKLSGDDCLPSIDDVPQTIVPSAYGTFGTYQNGYYLEFTTSSFSNFFIGGKTAFPVPVKLIDFSASVSGTKQVYINWNATNEESVNLYTVQKSSDGINFTSVESFSVNTTGKYQTSFDNTVAGMTYYRIQIKEISGQITYSKIVAISNERSSQFKISPNPVKDNLYVNLPQQNKGGILKIMSIDGSAKKNIQIKPDITFTSVDISNFSKGNYLIIFSDESTNRVIKFVKQ